ncbi:ADM2 [Oryzias melastigma]|uniref:ADM2 n=1 Tax=Oryzias melastigma TaxID=30732 RepID=A0A834CCF9_ORYME|nr:ADM2 [Oryzias melastigma]
MRSFLPLSVYCISLLCLQQLRASPVGERPDPHREDFFSKLVAQKGLLSITSGSRTNAVATSSPSSPPQKWKSTFLRQIQAFRLKATAPNVAETNPTEPLHPQQRALRARRQAHHRGVHQYPHNAQLMRVGCFLGTCQVQNLSHRLYQLVGQKGREESSPFNPKSPHSYG